MQGVCLSVCWDTPPLGVGMETSPWVWAWRPLRCGPADPPRCGPGDPLGMGSGDSPGCRPADPPGVGLETFRPDPSTSPLGVGLEIPLARPLNFPLGVGLETCKACWDTFPWRTAARNAEIAPAMHAGIPPSPLMNRILDTRF